MEIVYTIMRPFIEQVSKTFELNFTSEMLNKSKVTLIIAHCFLQPDFIPWFSKSNAVMVLSDKQISQLIWARSNSIAYAIGREEGRERNDAN